MNNFFKKYYINTKNYINWYANYLHKSFYVIYKNYVYLFSYVNNNFFILIIKSIKISFFYINIILNLHDMYKLHIIFFKKIIYILFYVTFLNYNKIKIIFFIFNNVLIYIKMKFSNKNKYM